MCSIRPVRSPRPATAGGPRAAYGRWLGFLAEADPDRRITSGLDHLDRETLAGFLARLAAVLAPYTVRLYLTKLRVVALGLAPERRFTALTAVVRHLDRTARRARDKRARLVPARDLYALGVDLMRAAESRRTPLQAAGTFRDGLMIALLAARPIRLSNLVSITIDQHLERQGDRYWLTFAAREVKNRRPLAFPLPEALTAPIERYLAGERPFLVAQAGRWKSAPGQALWVSANGSALKWRQVHERIVARTRARFGHPINPHLFRDAAATSIAIEDPDHVGIVAAILGHAAFQTAERYYNQATSLEATRRLQAVLTTYRT
jgi:integrase/recombinase XerD